MRINILTSGRFHVLDLAIELEKLGHDVKFYSYVPASRTIQFGLSKKASKSLLLVMIPFLAVQKLLPKSIFVENLKINFQDWFTSLYMKKCDVLIAMSGLYVSSLKKARANNSVIIIERGSKHILEQREILESISSLRGTKPVPDDHVTRELKSYELADFISLPSLHTKDSFIKHGFSKVKLFVNPYGVNLDMFKSKTEIQKSFDVIFVGNWSFQKGCDLLSQACIELNLKVLHVGAILDFPFPVHKNFIHIDTVDQKKLQNFYNQAKVFVLASRQDGFGMVLCQAIACKLPIVATSNTGGLDISLMDSSFKPWVFIPEDETVEKLKEQIILALKFAELKKDLVPNLTFLTWSGYGIRYNDFLKEKV